MKLTELDPRWLSYSTGRRGLGISFDCPHCTGRFKARVTVPFENPLDGKAPVTGFDQYFNRVGDDFTTLTVSPLIDGSRNGHWRGTITNGEVATC
jgi:hypothetical protein